jgi:tetratricopeptide (TPR) repeat protein
MAKKAKKITRKELLNQPDEFLSVSSRLFQYALEHKYQLLAALGAVIALVLIISGFRYSALKKAEAAFAQLEKGRTKYEALLQEQGSRQAYEQVRGDFQQLLEKYSGQTGGKFARLIFADICYRGGQPDEAIALYNAALEDFDDSFYRNTILNGLGYAYEEKQELEKAVAYFQQVAGSSGSVLKAEALFNAGRLYAALGMSEKSNQIFQQLAAEQPDSLYAELARERTAKAEPAD